MSNMTKHNGVNTRGVRPASDSDDGLIQLSPSVEDQVATGTKAILESPNVSEGPGRIANAPVPSIYRDDRGSIHRLRVGDTRVNLLHSKVNCMRSGYLHPAVKKTYVFSGRVQVWTLTPSGTDKKEYGPNSYYTIAPWVPHILYFLDDDSTSIAEWWDLAHDMECWFYHPYRRIVDVQNSLVSKTTGRHQLLVPQDEHDTFGRSDGTGGLPSRGSRIGHAVFWWATGVAAGVIIGAVLSSSDYKSPTSSRPSR